MDLNGKNVIIVGGYGGIGYALSQALLLKNVAIKQPELAAKLKAANTLVHFWPYDLTMDIAQMRCVFAEIHAKIETIDLLLNAAGICDDQKVDLTVQINLIGLIHTTSAAIELLDKRHGGKGGMVVNVASVAGLNVLPTLPVYSATKAAVISFTESLSILEPQTGIAAFTICPGITKTLLLDGVRAFMDFDANLAQNVAKAPAQTVTECVRHIVAAIEQRRNGAIWILDMGKMELVNKQQTFWEIPTELR